MLTARAVRRYATVHSVDSLYQIPKNSTVFSMIQPTGRIHLGNYLGALKSWRTISESDSEGTRYLYGIADLHALTMPADPKKLRSNRYEAMASLIASGLDEKKCILFHQSSIPEHTELNWILTCKTSMGYLSRMTQWKLKSNTNETDNVYEDKILDNVKMGLLSYPVLQAADILIYNSTHVPVGDDQAQHLELTRNVANSFNFEYKTKFFKIPNTLLAKNHKVLSLRNPLKKMSKSDVDQNGSIYITESSDEIAKKIRKSTTDSIQGPITYDTENRPGVSNLVTVLAGIQNKTVDEVVDELSWVKNHKQFKDHVTEVIVDEFKEMRETYNKLTNDLAYLEKISNEGRDKAREIASVNIKRVREIVGLD